MGKAHYITHMEYKKVHLGIRYLLIQSPLFVEYQLWGINFMSHKKAFKNVKVNYDDLFELVADYVKTNQGEILNQIVQTMKHRHRDEIENLTWSIHSLNITEMVVTTCGFLLAGTICFKSGRKKLPISCRIAVNMLGSHFVEEISRIRKKPTIARSLFHEKKSDVRDGKTASKT